MGPSTHDSTAAAALARLVDRIRGAAADGTALRLRGSGSKDFYGCPLQGVPLDTGEYRGVVAYEPTELVITARCGTPLAELEAALAERGQWLPFEPPAFGGAATVGGMVAAGLSGPGRMSAGAVRDFVLGAALVDGQGKVLNFGGQVMKNVAGYDVSRLLCGSLGMLGLIAEVSLKVLPVPAASLTLTLPIDRGDALRQLNGWAGRPLPLSASAWVGGTLALRLAGARAAVEAAAEIFVREHGASVLDGEVHRFWAAIREQTLPFFEGPGSAVGSDPAAGASAAGAPVAGSPVASAPAASARALWRLSVPSTASPLALPGEELIEWGGALRWWRTDAEPAAVRDAAARVGGHATLFRGGDRSQGVFAPLSQTLAVIHRRLKAEFDPKGIFNPGRMYPDL
ncbi:MAG: glycolate oxidase subunit GlcE [Burkholderiaceae bacterium]